MATFLTTTDTSAAIERVIREARTELTLISAYVYPRVIYLQRLKDAAGAGFFVAARHGSCSVNKSCTRPRSSTIRPAYGRGR